MSQSHKPATPAASPWVTLGLVLVHVLLWLAFLLYLLIYVPRHRVAFEDMVVLLPPITQIVIDVSTIVSYYLPIVAFPLLMWLVVHAIITHWMRGRLLLLSWLFLLLTLTMPLIGFCMCQFAISLAYANLGP